MTTHLSRGSNWHRWLHDMRIPSQWHSAANIEGHTSSAGRMDDVFNATRDLRNAARCAPVAYTLRLRTAKADAPADPPYHSPRTTTGVN